MHQDDALTVGLTPAELVGLQPHILDEILFSADRATLATCLRVNKTFFKIASPILYHTVRVDRHNMKKFFLGAFVGTNIDEDELECRLIMGEECTPPTNEPWHAEVGPKLLPTPPLEKQSKGDTNSPVGRPAITNFKAPLLGHVRVLSLGSHHCCDCRFYGTNVGPLLKNLDTLRIVPAPLAPFTIGALCDNRGFCPLFSSLSPRKLVFRNVGGKPVFRVRENVDNWNRSRLEEVVYVLPTDGRVYRNETVNTLYPVEHFGVPCKLIFHTGWELWNGVADPSLSVASDNWARVPVRPVDLVDPIFDTVFGTAFGLEAVDFHVGGPLPEDECEYAQSFRHENPHESLTSDRLRQFTKGQLMGLAVDDVAEHEDELDEYKQPLRFKSLSQYRQLPAEERRFELEEGLDPHLKVASLQSQQFFDYSGPTSVGFKAMKTLLRVLGDNHLLDRSVIEEFRHLLPFTKATALYFLVHLNPHLAHLDSRLEPPPE